MSMDQDLSQLNDALAHALAGLSSRDTQTHPTDQPQRWSIQQIAEHLLLTYQSTIPALRVRVEKRSATRAQPSLRQRIAQFLVIKLGRMPGGRKAPPLVSPSSPITVQDGAELTARIGRELAEIERLTAEGERLFGTRKAVSHLSFGPLSMRQWRRFHLVHGLHHVKQIQAIRRENNL